MRISTIIEVSRRTISIRPIILARDELRREEDFVPELSRFFGIIIRMYYDDHRPPHFHAIYAEKEAQVGIDPIVILQGDLPRRASSMVIEWAALHQHELLDNWERVRDNQPTERIEPLE
jgi:hypothetical protein